MVQLDAYHVEAALKLLQKRNLTGTVSVEKAIKTQVYMTPTCAEKGKGRKRSRLAHLTPQVAQ